MSPDIRTPHQTSLPTNKENSWMVGTAATTIIPSMIDSTIPPPLNQRFYLSKVSWLLDTKKDARKIYLHALSCVPGTKGYRTMTSGWQGAPYFGTYGRELVSKQAIWLEKGWEGYRRTTSLLITSWQLTISIETRSPR